MKAKGARLLNERPGWLGLSVWDLSGVGYSLILSHGILRLYGLELLAFIFAGIVFLSLLRIRLKSRPKTIRDYVKSKLQSRRIG